ncbi:MAG: SpoIIE family protein phosphatase [Prolixibacteraceae bacterium]|nr:SpoIIE family protein phosphatase [Prolixibacteraceae bacterium]
MELNINKSLASRIVFYVLVFCVALFLISLGAFYFFSKNQLEKMAYNNSQAVANQLVFKTEQVLLPITKIANNYQSIIEHSTLNADSIYAITRRIVANNSEIIGSAIAFEPNFFKQKGKYFSPYTYRENDTLKTIQLGNPNYEYFVMDWYQIPMRLGKAYWSEPYFDTGGGNALMTTYSVPFNAIVDGQVVPAGVITMDLELDWFTEIISEVKILESGYASVLSRNGTFITHPNKEWIMNESIFSVAEELNNPQLREIGRDMQQGKTAFVVSTLNGVDRIMYYTPLPSSNWMLAVLFPKSEMYLPLRTISIILIILIVVGLGVLSVSVERIVSEQLRPLSKFAKSAREVATGNFDAALPEITTDDEMKDLHDSFAHMQSDLKNYISNLKDTTSAKEKIESELRIAREIQMGMIPKIFPPFPNLSQIDLFAMLEPAKEVGGDLYDFFMIDDNHLCFAIGDVSGKGVPASLFMAVTRTLLRSVAPNQTSPAYIVDKLNQALSSGNDSNMFVTFFIGIINTDTGIVKYTNAGHNPPVWISAGGKVEFLPVTKDIPIGLFDDFQYQEREMVLKPKDKLYLYTDGVTEAENASETLYSEKKLINCLSIYLRSHPRELIQQVAMDVAVHVGDFPQSDDLTMLSIIYNGDKA